MVRGYQKANTTNQPFTDLGNAIIEAKGIRNQPANATGDREASPTSLFQKKHNSTENKHRKACKITENNLPLQCTNKVVH